MIDCGHCELIPSSDILMNIIKAQTQIVKMGHELGSVMTIVAEKARELTECDGSTIELYENDEMIYRAVAGSLELFLGFKLSAKNSLSGLCVQSGHILYCEDTENDARVDRNAAHKVGAKSMVVVPLKFGNANVGVLKVISSKKHYFNNHSICILSMMAETMGAAMYHAGEHTLEELLIKATTDAMTGVENRASFYEKLRLGISNNSHNTQLSIFIIDMDGLKSINDTYGHRAGDEAIKELAKRLIDSSRSNDIIARLGGDEFGLILSPLSSTNEIHSVIDRFDSEMSKPFYFEDVTLNFGASIGFALYPDEANDMAQLIDLADKRMYHNKQQRKRA